MPRAPPASDDITIYRIPSCGRHLELPAIIHFTTAARIIIMPQSISCRCTNISIPVPTADGVDGEMREVSRDQVTIVRTSPYLIVSVAED